MRATTILELMTLPALAILVAPAVLHWTVNGGAKGSHFGGVIGSH